MTRKRNALRILEILRKVIYSDSIIKGYKMNKTDFSRVRKQPFGDMLLFMINFLKKSLPIEIDNFVNFLNSNARNLKIKDFTKSAFVQKRRKINPEVFKYLTTVISDNFYVENNPGFDSLYGYRILAVDGSKISLPFTEELKGAFGVTTNQHKTEIVQAVSSVLYDVLNRIV